MSGILLGLIIFFGWGTGDIFGVYATRKEGAYRTAFHVFLFGFLASSLYLPFAISDISLISWEYFLLNVLMGCAFMVGNVMLAESFARSSASVVGVVAQSFPAVVLLLSALIFKDPVSPIQLVFILVIFAGVFLCSVDFADLKQKKLIKDRGIGIALIAAGIFSLFFTFLRIVTDVYGWFLPNYIAFATFPIALLISKKIFAFPQKISFIQSRSVVFATFMTGVLIRSADIALNVGVARGLASVVAPLGGSAPILFVVLSRLIYKDPITRQQQFGIFIALTGIFLLSFVG